MQCASDEKLKLRVYLEHERRGTRGGGDERFEKLHPLFKLLILVAAAHFRYLRCEAAVCADLRELSRI